MADTAPRDLRELPLRERKFARTKVALLRAALRRLRGGHRLAEVSVKELCREVEVSEATFFNYFPRKSDLLLYYVQLWTLEAGARTVDLPGLAAIDEIFRFTGERLHDGSTVLLELIARLAANEGVLTFPDVSPAERLEAFPDLPAALHAELRVNVTSLFRGHLERARADGELRSDVEVELLVRALASLFFGLPLVRHCAGVEPPLDALWREQLDLLWAGVRA